MVIDWYHVFGSGSGMVYFRPTRAGFSPFAEFYEAAKAAAEDDGHNGFVGTYSCPDEIGEKYGWASKAVFWPPASDDYRPGAGWHTASYWLRAEKDLQGIRMEITFADNGEGDWGKFPYSIRMSESRDSIRETVRLFADEVRKELTARLLGVQEYRLLYEKGPDT